MIKSLKDTVVQCLISQHGWSESGGMNANCPVTYPVLTFRGTEIVLLWFVEHEDGSLHISPEFESTGQNVVASCARTIKASDDIEQVMSEFQINIDQDLLTAYSVKVGPVTDADLVIKNGYKLVSEHAPIQLKERLRAAADDGVIGHLPQEGNLQECFYAPGQKQKAMDQRESFAKYGALGPC